MPSEGAKKINEMMRQGRRRYTLIVENGKGKVVRVVPSDDDAGTDGERPGAEARVRLPWVAVPKRN
jgi:hypothetical protein